MTVQSLLAGGCCEIAHSLATDIGLHVLPLAHVTFMIVSKTVTFSPRLLNLLCHVVLLMSEDQLVVSGPVPVRIRPPPWLSTLGLRRSCPHAA